MRRSLNTHKERRIYWISIKYDFTHNRALSSAISGAAKGNSKQAKEAYAQFTKDPYHPGLHFKRVHSTRPIYSARISKDYRAVGVQQNSEII